MRWRYSAVITVVLALFLCAGVEHSFAQLDTGSITGIVRDASGAVLPKANVTVTNTKTGRVWHAKSGNIGEFTVPALPSGPYNVRAEAPGFKVGVVSGLTLRAMETARADIALQIGTATEQVTVEAGMTAVNTTTSEMGATVDSVQAGNLPLNGRDFNTLLALVPGSNMTSGLSDSMDGYNVDFTGLNTLLDGTDATRLDGNSRDVQMGRSQSRITRASVDSIQEFRVLSSAYSAEFGRSVGNVINVITKSGGNDFHGSLFDYFRNDYLDAKNYFFRPDQPTPLRLNQFGGNLSGPIVKKKLFFFGNYEGVRQVITNPAMSNVLNQAMRDRAVAAIKPIVDAIPVGNAGPSTGFYTDPNTGVKTPFSTWFDVYTGTLWNRLREDTMSFKVDYLPTEKDTIAFRYNLNDGLTRTKYGLAFGQVSESPNRVQLGKISWNRVFSPTLLNEAGLAIDRPRTDSYSGDKTFPMWNCFFCQIGLGLMPGPALFDIKAPSLSVQLIDTLTVVSGKHTFKFGGDIRKSEVNRYLGYQDTLTWGGGGAYGDPTAMLANQGMAWQRLGYPMSGLWNWNYAFFANDDIRVTPRLSVTLGLRWDYATPIHDPTNKMRNFDLNKLSFTDPKDPYYNTNSKDFGPRIGFNWDPFGNSKTSIRGGYGIFWMPITAGTLINLPSNTNPNFSVNVFDFWGNRTCDQPVTFTYPLPANPPNCTPQPPQSIQSYDPNMKDSYSQHWNFGIQQELLPNTVLEVAYVGNRGIHLPTYMDVNTYVTGMKPPTLPDNARPISTDWASITWSADIAGSKYDAMQVSLRHNVGHGLNVVGNYTWSHETDNVLAFFETYQNIHNLHDEWASGYTDVRHNLTGSVVWDIPRLSSKLPTRLAEGWQFTSLLQTRTGVPFNVWGENGGWNPSRRANCVAGVDVRPNNYSLPNVQINSAAFTAPVAGEYGNCPRNVGRGPGFFQTDMGLAKNTKVTERLTWQFRGELFNVFNHPNFANPAVTTFNQMDFGRSIATVNNLLGVGTSRQMQLSMKLIF